MSYRRVFTLMALISLPALAAIRAHEPHANAANADPGSIEVFADNPQQSVIAGFDFSSIDRSVNACQDFNRFANGGWIAKNPVPGAYSVWGRFTQLSEQNQNVLHDILDGLAKKKNLTVNERKIADFYGSCMNEP